MIDERIESKLAVIKKSIFIVWTIISFLSILTKAFALRQIPTLSQGLTEYVVFLLSAFVLLIHLLIHYLNETVDERIIRTIHKLYSYAFKIVIILAMIAYLYQLITLDSFIIGLFPINSFINSFFSLTFIVYYLYARRQSIYFNYRHIENDRKTYFLAVLKNVLVIIISGFLAYLIIYLTDLLNLYEIKVLEVTVSIALSIVLIIFEYLLLSVIEYNHYNEQILHEQGKTILLSKNYLILFVLTSIFSLIYILFNQYYYNIMISINDYPNDLILKLEVIGKLLVYAEFDQYLLRIIMIAIFYHSLKRSLPHHLKSLKIVILLQLLFLSYSLLNFVHSNLILPIIVQTLDGTELINYMKIVNFLNLSVQFISLIIPFLLYLYFSKEKFRFASFFLLLLGTNVISALLPLFINRINFSFLYSVVYVILIFASMIISLIIYFDATKIVIEKRPEISEIVA